MFLNGRRVIRSEVDLELLAELLKQLFSHDYETMEDARKMVKAGMYWCSFDATTLILYDSNINDVEYGKLHDLLLPFYWDMYKSNREIYKELLERRVLLRFLLSAPEEYGKYRIKKHIRPDFVLIGDKKIGVEITELTTQEDKRFFAFCRSMLAKRYVAGHRQRDKGRMEGAGENVLALKRSEGMYRLLPVRARFAEEIKTKYEKYENMLGQFDEFIILGDAASGSGIEISCKNEVDEVIHHLLYFCPKIINFTTVIAWREAEHQEKIIHSWYKTA